MSGKQIVITIMLAILAVGGGYWLVTKYFSAPKPNPISQTENNIQNPAVTPTLGDIKFLTWNDEAGFTCQYPEGLKIDNHPNDNVNYANLTITDSGGLGSIEILMKDDIYKTLDKWVKSDSNLTAGNIMDTDLGGKNAKKIIAVAGQMVVGAIDNGVLVTIKKEAGVSPLLETAWGKIIDSWEFVYPTQTVKAGNNQDSGGNVLEEEN